MQEPFIEKVAKCFRCDTTQLVNLPGTVLREWPTLDGQSPKQISFGTSARAGRLAKWRPDLAPEVGNALLYITDSGWWIKHLEAEVEDIAWPEQWISGDFECPRCGCSRTASETIKCPNPECPTNREPRQPELGSRPGKLMEASVPPLKPQDLTEFEAFARKAAMFPELAYLTMMALLYRQTKSPVILQKFIESRRKVQGHLDAIDKILGSPGE